MPYNTLQFITDNPKSALERIHRQLGPEAVVLSVRRVPARGVARLWQKKCPVEIVAGVPDKTTWSEPPKRSLAGPGDATPVVPLGSSHRWQTVAWLEVMGLLPANAQRLQNRLDSLHPSAPASLDAEERAVHRVLADFWSASREPRSAGFQPAGDGGILAAGSVTGQDARPTCSQDGRATTPAALKGRRATHTHVFVGPPGSGKTTVLCKWLTLAVLTEERSARVWRLNGSSANTAEFLTVHCEMLEVPVERCWSEVKMPADLHFVDLPGVEADDARALTDLRNQVSALPSPKLHLVLNSAYDTDLLLAQFSAFAPFEPADLILTHLDEEIRRIKLWNLVLGTNCTILFLSAGQKIPGQFRKAAPDLLFPSEIRQ